MNKFILTGTAILLLAAGCINNSNSGNNNSNQATSGGHIEHVNPPQEKLDTTNWKAYSDEHISFKYPAMYAVASANNGGWAEYELDKTPSGFYSIHLSYKRDTYQGLITNFYTNLDKTKPLQVTTVNGQDAYVFNSGQFQTWYVLFHSGTVYLFEIENFRSPQNYQPTSDLFDTILTTVQLK